MTRFQTFTALALVCATPALAADATVQMQGPDGGDMGQVMLTETPHGMLVQAEITGLSTGPHAFHIHETGACTPEFETAGGHYNPAGADHGIMNESGRHAGDLPNIHAAEDGTARADFLVTSVTLGSEGEAPLMDADGSAFIVHANPDDYIEEAGAGGRVACGVIASN